MNILDKSRTGGSETFDKNSILVHAPHATVTIFSTY